MPGESSHSPQRRDGRGDPGPAANLTGPGPVTRRGERRALSLDDLSPWSLSHNHGRHYGTKIPGCRPRMAEAVPVGGRPGPGVFQPDIP
jgi:hypothetical protein